MRPSDLDLAPILPAQKVVVGRILFSKKDQLILQAECRSRTGLPITRTEALAAHLVVCMQRARKKLHHHHHLGASKIQVDLVYDIRNLVVTAAAATTTGNVNLPVASFLDFDLLAREDAVARVSAMLHRDRQKLSITWRDSFRWLEHCRNTCQPTINTCLGMCLPGNSNVCISPLHRLGIHSTPLFDGALTYRFFLRDGMSYLADGLVFFTDTRKQNEEELEVTIDVLADVWAELAASPETIFPSSLSLIRSRL